MFGFSLTKLLFTAAAIALVWYGFKWIGRMQQQKELQAKENARKATRQGRGDPLGQGGGAAPEVQDVEDMVKCKACGVFMPANSRSCGRSDCPYPG